MFIITIKNGYQYWTDAVEKTASFYKFETVTKKGIVHKHELAISEIQEIDEQEGTLEDFRKELEKEKEGIDESI